MANAAKKKFTEKGFDVMVVNSPDASRLLKESGTIGQLVSGIEDLMQQQKAQEKEIKEIEEEKRRIREVEQINIEMWKGTLVWTEGHSDKKNSESEGYYTTRRIGCKVKIRPEDERFSVANWTEHLFIKFIPQGYLNGITDLLKNAKPLWFFPLESVESKSLMKLICPEHSAGYIQFPSEPPGEMRVLMLFYSNKQKQFVGMIPRDQDSFTTALNECLKRIPQEGHEHPSAKAEVVKDEVNMLYYFQSVSFFFLNIPSCDHYCNLHKLFVDLACKSNRFLLLFLFDVFDAAINSKYVSK